PRTPLVLNLCKAFPSLFGFVLDILRAFLRNIRVNLVGNTIHRVRGFAQLALYLFCASEDLICPPSSLFPGSKESGDEVDQGVSTLTVLSADLIGRRSGVCK